MRSRTISNNPSPVSPTSRASASGRSADGHVPVQASGLKLLDGRVFGAPRIVANLGPKPLFLGLLAAEDLPADFRAHIERWRVGSATFRMNVAMAELPRFSARRSRADDTHLGAGIIIAPSLGYMDRAFADARLCWLASRAARAPRRPPPRASAGAAAACNATAEPRGAA